MGAMFIGQQFLQNVLEYSTLDSGAAILPAAVFMVIAAPRSAKLVEARGARFTLLLGYVFCLLGFLTMLLLWKTGIPYWKVALGYIFVGIGVGPGGHAGLALPDGFGARSGGPAWRRGRPTCSATSGGAIMQSILGALLTAGLRDGGLRATSPHHRTRRAITTSVENQLTKSFSSAEAVAKQYPHYASAITEARQVLVHLRRELGLRGRHHRHRARRGAHLLPVPGQGGRDAAAGRVPRDRRRGGSRGDPGRLAAAALGTGCPAAGRDVVLVVSSAPSASSASWVVDVVMVVVVVVTVVVVMVVVVFCVTVGAAGRRVGDAHRLARDDGRALGAAFRREHDHDDDQRDDEDRRRTRSRRSAASARRSGAGRAGRLAGAAAAGGSAATLTCVGSSPGGTGPGPAALVIARSDLSTGPGGAVWPVTATGRRRPSLLMCRSATTATVASASAIAGRGQPVHQRRGERT